MRPAPRRPASDRRAGRPGHTPSSTTTANQACTAAKASRIAGNQLAGTPPKLAVGRRSAWSAAWPPLALRQIVRGRILPQPTDDQHAQGPQQFQERPLGIGSLGHDPHPLSRRGHLLPCPKHLRMSLLESGGELPDELREQPGNVLLLDVERRPQRQTDRSPQRMPHHPGQGDPNVPVEKLGVGRSGRRVVMDAGALNLRPATLGGCIVQGQEHMVGGGQVPQ